MSGFPKSIESIFTKYTVDETGFSETEKVGLTNAWNLIKADRKKHAMEIFLRFFLAHAKYLKYFRMCEDRFNVETLHAHSDWVLQSYNSLVEDGLRDVAKLNAMLSNIIKCHKNIRLTGPDMDAMAEIANNYFKEVLARYMTPTLETALNKIRVRFTEGYENREAD